MKVSEIMTGNVVVMDPNASLIDIAKKMDQLNVGAMPIVEGEKLVGMITDRDIVVRCLAHDRDPRAVKAKEVLSGDVTCCFEDQDVEEAVELMEDKQIRRLPILSREKRLVGVLSLGDIATGTGNSDLTGEALSEVSTPSQPVH